MNDGFSEGPYHSEHVARPEMSPNAVSVGIPNADPEPWNLDGCVMLEYGSKEEHLMAITAETLMELIDDARANRVRIDSDITRVRDELTHLEQRLVEARAEEEMYRLTLERKFPSTSTMAEPTALEGLDEANEDMSEFSRTDAVAQAVRVIATQSGVASPEAVEHYLRSRNRSDTRDAIGAALAYLNRRGKVRNVGRARWTWSGSNE